MDQPYSRELMDSKLDNILLRIEEVRIVATETRDQAKRTNGRVTRLEGWRQWMIGGSIGISTIVGLGVYIYFYQFNILDHKIDTHITQTNVSTH